MAKKEYNNVVIKDEELTPTTIGIYSNKTKNPIGLIILAAIFITVAFYLPDIQNYVNKALGKTDDDISYNGNNNNNKKDDNDNDDKKNQIIKYNISSTTEVSTNDYSLSDIKFDGSNFTFTFKNKTNGAFDLSNYYIEVYSNVSTFIGRVKVSNDVIELNDSESYVLTIPSSATEFTFIKKTVDEFPKVTLNYDENKMATLICKNNTKRYAYTFADEQLIKIAFVYNLDNSNATYYEQYNEYKSKADSYGLQAGVTSSFSDTVSTFNYNLNVDLSVADISKIDDNNLFKIKTSPKEVKFIAEAQGLSCNQE